MVQKFNFNNLLPEDYKVYQNFIGEDRAPDLVIAPNGFPYLYRWHMVPRGGPANIYFHVQVADDPERPLHNHPWDNMSVILAGGYKETLSLSEGEPSLGSTNVFIRQKGDVIYRRAKQAHRLQLLTGEAYAMTLFTAGPKINDWGFWYPEGFRPYQEVTVLKDGMSVHVKGSDAQRSGM